MKTNKRVLSMFLSALIVIGGYTVLNDLNKKSGKIISGVKPFECETNYWLPNETTNRYTRKYVSSYDKVLDPSNMILQRMYKYKIYKPAKVEKDARNILNI